GYTRQRAVPFEAGTHAPDFVIVRHEPEAGCVLLAMHLSSHQVLTRLLKLDPAWTLEEMWEKGKRTWGGQGLAGPDGGRDGPGQRLEQAGPQRLPDGDGLRREVPGSGQPVPS